MGAACNTASDGAAGDSIEFPQVSEAVLQKPQKPRRLSDPGKPVRPHVPVIGVGRSLSILQLDDDAPPDEQFNGVALRQMQLVQRAEMQKALASLPGVIIRDFRIDLDAFILLASSTGKSRATNWNWSTIERDDMLRRSSRSRRQHGPAAARAAGDVVPSCRSSDSVRNFAEVLSSALLSPAALDKKGCAEIVSPALDKQECGEIVSPTALDKEECAEIVAAALGETQLLNSNVLEGLLHVQTSVASSPGAVDIGNQNGLDSEEKSVVPGAASNSMDKKSLSKVLDGLLHARDTVATSSGSVDVSTKNRPDLEQKSIVPVTGGAAIDQTSLTNALDGLLHAQAHAATSAGDVDVSKRSCHDSQEKIVLSVTGGESIDKTSLASVLDGLFHARANVVSSPTNVNVSARDCPDSDEMAVVPASAGASIDKNYTDKLFMQRSVVLPRAYSSEYGTRKTPASVSRRLMLKRFVSFDSDYPAGVDSHRRNMFAGASPLALEASAQPTVAIMLESLTALERNLSWLESARPFQPKLRVSECLQMGGRLEEIAAQARRSELPDSFELLDLADALTPRVAALLLNATRMMDKHQGFWTSFGGCFPCMTPSR